MSWTSIILAFIGFVAMRFATNDGKASRKRKIIAGLVYAAFLMAVVGIPIYNNRAAEREAIARGFENIADENAAKEAGVTNSTEWFQHKKTVAAKKAKLEAEAEAVAEAKFTAAKAAGYESAEDQDAAKAAGIANAAQWQKKKVLAALLEKLKKVDRSIQSVGELDTVDGLSLDVTIMTRDVDANSFSKIGYAVSEIAKQLQETKANYALVRVLFRVPVSDKYGNDTDLKGGHIFWKVAELNKVNLDKGVDFIFRAADTVYLRRFGAEMARDYCLLNDFRDKRYCTKP